MIPMEIVWFLLFLFILYLIWFSQKVSDKMKRRPPGPFRFPLLGCMPQMLWADAKFPFLAFEKLSKHYGNIIYVQFGLNKGVAIHGYDAVMEMYRSDDWLGRFDDKFILNHSFGKPIGLINGTVDIWRESRHFSGRVLREFNFGVKRQMECMIQEELTDFSTMILDKIEKTGGILHVEKLFNFASLNIVWSMASGVHFSYDDRKLIQLVQLLDDYNKSGSMGAGLLTSYPFLIDWAPKLVGFDIMDKSDKGVQKYLKRMIIETRSEGHYLTNPTNFIETFLQKIDTRESTNNLDDIVYSDENLITILYDLLIAGTEASGNHMEFGLLHIILNPAIQDKIRDEIDSVIGSHRKPEIEDRQQMPYTEATILEIYRTSNVVPFAPRKLHMDATIGKYRLEKGTMVYGSLYSVAMDKKVWGDPEVFRPERFLSPEGKVMGADRLITFGAGRRNCFGESVARATIFIMFTGLIQKFKFEINPAEERPTAKLCYAFTCSPAPFSMVVTPRN